ncbi:hypothetical protein [Cumulibacter manganitolerans]|uniref:hypothetical protein n=1 Tax=Cumulibacter manganitolerans TaxID=1884992 RepID=UPI001295EFA2|nr:hypothetical protein [Cumulibacter manganitolerans]
MSNLGFALEGAWKVLLAGLLFGAGLPLIFALGVRAMAYGAGGAAETGEQRPHPIGRLIGIACFLVVLGAVALGIAMIVASGFGKEVVFHGVLPVVQDKGH